MVPYTSPPTQNMLTLLLLSYGAQLPEKVSPQHSALLSLSFLLPLPPLCYQ